LYQQNNSAHVLIAPIRHKLIALQNFVSPEQLHQAWGTTSANRRPKLWASLREIFPDRTNAKLLSFGCSTGEELLDLAQYYPQATLFGTDINRARLRQAQRLVPRSKSRLFFASAHNLQKYGPFDLIVACSVFIRHPEDTHTDDLSSIYPFSVFEKGIRQLFENVRIGGLLLIYNANYCVMSTSVANRLSVVLHHDILQQAQVPLFGVDGRKLPHSAYAQQLFRRDK
jgi:hypothetical protein